MITAIDTNVLLDVLIPNEKFFELSLRAVEKAASDGSLVVCDVVYAELCVQFTTRRGCDQFLESNEIRVEPLSRDAHFLASRIWLSYRRQGGSRPQIPADFLIGAHAMTQANRLVSRDRGFYRKLFPKLSVIDPARGGPGADTERGRL
jgi:predicted nucleic acid-binding protein